MNRFFKRTLWFSLLSGILVWVYGCSDSGKTQLSSGDWCQKKLRPELKRLTEVKTSRPWFKVYDVGQNVYAIAEPYNYEETIGYLVLGKEKALLFDTGMGLDSVSKVVNELTKLPVWVLNSHTHPDHIGGNHEFNHILAMNTLYTRANAVKGYSHKQVQDEVSPSAFCLNRLPSEDTAHYSIKPFKVSNFIADGYIIDLGGRKLQVIATPGHSPDAICLYDKQAGYLWTGDSYYPGPIFLFSDSTNIKAYSVSIAKMARIATVCSSILPAHNLPIVDPAQVTEASKAFSEIEKGTKKGMPNADNTVSFKFDKFSFLIKKDLLK